MIPPILFVDEKPFWDADNKAIKALAKLKNNITENGDDSLIEFFFEKNNEFPFDFQSDDFKNMIDGRKFIFIHNSYPHTNGRTLFPLSIIRDMEKNLVEKVKIIKFSGQMYRRGRDDQDIVETKKEQLKVEQKLIESDILIERDDVYANTDKFIKHCKGNFENPNFYILKYGIEANRGKAQEIEIKMKAMCKEEYFEDKNISSSLVSVLESSIQKNNATRPKKRLKKDWKDLLVPSFNQICELAELDENRKKNGLKLMMSDEIQYTSYFNIIDKLINQEVKLLSL